MLHEYLSHESHVEKIILDSINIELHVHVFGFLMAGRKLKTTRVTCGASLLDGAGLDAQLRTQHGCI